MPNDGSLGRDQGQGWAKDGSGDGIGRVSINQIEQLIGGDLDLLRNLPNNAIKSTLKGKVYNNPYSSGALLAEFDASDQSSLSDMEIFDHISTGHNGTFVDSTPIEYKPSDSIAKTSISKISTTGVSPRDISPFQVSSSEVNTINPSITQISPFQVSSSEVGVVEFSPLQISSRQIDSRQIDFVRQTNIDEVSLTSGIPFQQFFNGNSGSIKFSENPIGIEEIGVSGIDREFLDSTPDSHSSFVFDGVNNGTGHNISPQNN